MKNEEKTNTSRFQINERQVPPVSTRVLNESEMDPISHGILVMLLTFRLPFGKKVICYHLL